MKKEEFIKNIKFWDWKAYKNTFKNVKLEVLYRNDVDCQDFLLIHVLNNGIKENRKIIIDKNNKECISKQIIEKNFHLLLPSNFNWKEYIDLNEDLKKCNEIDAKIHYIKNGNYEGRNYKKCEIKYHFDKCANKYLTKVTDNIKTPDFFNYPLLNNILNKELDSDTIKYNNDLINKINNSGNIDINWNFWGKDQLNIKKEEIIKFKNHNLLHEIPKEINELFIPHYKPNIERKKYIEKENETLKYNINYITKYDGNELYKNRRIFKNNLNSESVSFSIITATYGHSDFIKDTLDSINCQKYRNWENIIYDANNDNKTQEIVTQYISNNDTQNKIHYIKEKDRGQVHAINKGFIECNGSILHFLNSDDIFFDENVLERVAKEFEDDDTLDILYGAGHFIDENNNIIADLVKWRPYSLNTDPYTFIEHFKSHVSMLQPSVFFRKRVIEKIGLLDDNDQYAFDHDFWIRTLRSNCKWKFIECNLSKALLQSDAKTVAGKVDQVYYSLKTSFKNFDNVSDVWIDKYIKVLNDDFFEKLENQKTYNPSKLEIETKRSEILQECNNEKLKIQLSSMNLYDYNRFNNSKLSMSEYSLYCKLLYILSHNKSFYHFSEDDILFTEYHTKNFQEAFKIFIKDNYDIMFLGGACDHIYPKDLENNKFIYKIKHNRGGMLELLISNRCVSKIYIDLLQIDSPIDLKLEYLIRKYELNVSWYVPEISIQGSKNNCYEGNLNNSDINCFMDSNFKIKEYPINIRNYFYNYINEPFNKYHQSEFTIVITNFQRLKYLKNNVYHLLKNGFYNFIISCYSPSEEHFEFFKDIQKISSLIRINMCKNDYGVNKLWINGLQMVKTKYVLILHDDDYLNDNFFENFIDINKKLKEFNYILWNGRACNNNNEEVWRGNVLQLYNYPDKNFGTGIKNSQALLNNYMNGNGFVISPVIQIFETKKSLHILQWCELNYKYPENYSRPKMMLGNEIALTYYNLKYSDNFYFYNEYYTTYIQSETSETFINGQKLLKGYNNARALLKNNNVDLLINNNLIKVFVINTKDKYHDNKNLLDQIKNNPNIFLEEIYLKYDNNIIGDYINDNFQHTLIINSYNLSAIHKIVTQEIKDSCIKYTNNNDNIKIDNINDIKQIDITCFNNIDFIYLHT